MRDLIKLLKSFNRKERFYLIGKSLGNQDFKLSKEFRDEIGNILGLSIPGDAFAAMDYNMDWIYASLCYYKYDKSIYKNDGNISATQQNVDLLISFHSARISHIILIEAEGGYEWEKKQFILKTKRLKSIFGYHGSKWPNVKPYFLVASPAKPKKLNVTLVPPWMKKNKEVLWFPIKLASNLVKVTRCDKKGIKFGSGRYWKIEKSSN
ncbi:MAG: hypothetical protein KAT05_13340 [Spirochaetes bacterium]|nr:hypothetical protein [Spirochaetota bacterium]